MAKSIPKKTLIHSATMYRNAVRDAWKNITSYGAAIELTHVRVKSTDKTIKTANNEQKQLRAELIYDCRNSRPLDIAFRAGDIIVYDDEQYDVETVDRYWDKKRLHHYTLGLG